MKYAYALILPAAFVGHHINAQEVVNGYVKQDGTYVQPYFRTQANNTKTDNYSYTRPSQPRQEWMTQTNKDSHPTCGAHNMGCGSWNSGLRGSHD